MSDILDRLSTVLADRYELERQIGEGGMATVYLARDIRHGRKVAIKVLRPELAARLRLDFRSGPRVVGRTTLFKASYAAADHANFDVHPDGTQFVVLTGRARPQRIIVALNPFVLAAHRR